MNGRRIFVFASIFQLTMQKTTQKLKSSGGFVPLLCLSCVTYWKANAQQIAKEIRTLHWQGSSPQSSCPSPHQHRPGCSRCSCVRESCSRHRDLRQGEQQGGSRVAWAAIPHHQPLRRTDSDWRENVSLVIGADCEQPKQGGMNACDCNYAKWIIWN